MAIRNSLVLWELNGNLWEEIGILRKVAYSTTKEFANMMRNWRGDDSRAMVCLRSGPVGTQGLKHKPASLNPPPSALEKPSALKYSESLQP